EPRLRYVQIGSIAGESIAISAHSLRSSGLEILGSGIGSLSMDELVTGARQLLAALPEAGFDTPV
ncbi:zinc-binding alcohol dehydrogenase family protein, partial [Burkholderia sp. SIMBA_048]